MKDLSNYNIQCQEDYFMILDELEREEVKMSKSEVIQEIKSIVSSCYKLAEQIKKADALTSTK